MSCALLRAARGAVLSSLVSLSVACSASSEGPAPADAPVAGDEIVPASGIGAVRLGMRYADVRALLGEAKASGQANLVFGRWADRGVEVVFASGEGTTLSDDAVVLAVSASSTGAFRGAVRPGMSRAEIVKVLGAPTDVVGAFGYWASGISVRFSGDGDGATAVGVAVHAPYVSEAVPPEMKAASGTGKATKAPDRAGTGRIDMHLHPGFFGRVPPTAKTFVVGSIPPFAQLYAPAALSVAIDPWAPFVGIRDQTATAGIDHAVLYAVYTHHTTGFFTNEDLEKVLTDPRNVAADGAPWAWGFASVNFFDGYVRADGTVDDAVAKPRLAALASYFEARRDVFIGIKLAHAHQAVAFDDARYLGVYDVAAKYDVPVYLHTGFSPFPGAKNERAFYDPEGLRNTIKNLPKVRFVLGHVGQGDAGAVDHCLALAKEFPNVYLEISALNRPTQRDAAGADVTPDASKPQYPYVLAQIRARGLIGKTIFGTDGPQFAGMVKGYVTLIEKAMSDAGYSADEIRAVMRENFLAVYFPSK